MKNGIVDRKADQHFLVREIRETEQDMVTGISEELEICLEECFNSGRVERRDQGRRCQRQSAEAEKCLFDETRTFKVKDDHPDLVVGRLIVDLGVSTHHMSAGEGHAEGRLDVAQGPVDVASVSLS